MSSNPFRRSVASKLPGVESSSSTASSNQTSGDDAFTTPAQPQTKKKRVKIQTPPDSPELIPSPEHAGRRLSASDSAGRADSPPPPVPTAVENGEEESDSTTTADSDLEEALKNTRRNSGSLPPVGDAPPASRMRAPFNPFARTLASKERDAPGREAAQDQKSGEQRPGAGRPALDVDQFKNILMTGSAAPSPPTGGATTAGAAISQPRPPDSSSNSTDTSSLFDPAYGVHPASPRHSFDDYEDASENEEEDDTEHSTLMGGDGRLDDLAPPAPPKPQKPRGPQTVSFADFDQTIPPDFISSQRAKSPANPQLTGILRPPMTRSSSDLNKPLPPPPRSPAGPPPNVPAKDSPPPQQSQTVAASAEDPAGSKKAPPPPPTRRKAPDSGRPRSSSNLSNTTQDSVTSMGTTGSAQPAPFAPKTDDSGSKLAPPPPPARKSNPSSQSSTPAVDTPPKEPSPSNSTNEVPKAAPAPPPRRHPSKATRETPSHSPAGIGRQSMKPGDAFLSSITPGNTNPPSNAPPAPPPRRAAGSKRTSFDGPPDTLARRLSTEHHRRSSNNSFDSERSGSISSLRRVAEPDEQAVVSPPAEQRDILADMTAFQAEIDALRAQNEKAG